jgi:uncharacterized membrane protein
VRFTDATTFFTGSGRGASGIGGGVNRAGCLASVIGAIVLIFLGRVLGWA